MYDSFCLLLYRLDMELVRDLGGSFCLQKKHPEMWMVDGRQPSTDVHPKTRFPKKYRIIPMFPFAFPSCRLPLLFPEHRAARSALEGIAWIHPCQIKMTWCAVAEQGCGFNGTRYSKDWVVMPHCPARVRSPKDHG